MKSLILTFALLVCQINVSSTQDFKIFVKNDQRQALPYAYLFINGKTAAITDTLGVATIPIRKISTGDTISASFIGAESAAFVYTESIKKQNSYEFMLKEKLVGIDAVMVYGTLNSKKLFHKKTKVLPPVIYNSCTTADFVFNMSEPSASEKRTVLGSFYLENQIWFGKPKDGLKDGWYNLPIEFNTTSDTLNISAILDKSIRGGLQILSPVLMGLNTKKDEHKIYMYLGKQDGNDLFRITYSYEQSAFVTQALISVSEDTHYINNMEVSIIAKDSVTNNGNVERIVASADLERYWHKKPLMTPVMVTKDLSYTIIYKDGTVVNTDMSNEFTQAKKMKVKVF